MFIRENPSVAKASIIAIVGPPCAGKTTLADQLVQELPGYDLICTDDYIGVIGRLFTDVKDKKGIIVEGTLVTYLLKNGGLHPNVIIRVNATDVQLMHRYHKRRGRQYPFSIKNQVAEQLFDYLESLKGTRPTIINHWS